MIPLVSAGDERGHEGLQVAPRVALHPDQRERQRLPDLQLPRDSGAGEGVRLLPRPPRARLKVLQRGSLADLVRGGHQRAAGE